MFSVTRMRSFSQLRSAVTSVGLLGRVNPSQVDISGSLATTTLPWLPCLATKVTAPNPELLGCVTTTGQASHDTAQRQQLRFYRSGRVSRSSEDETEKPDRASPQMMDFPWIVWPSLYHTIRNWIFANLLIYRYLDQEFNIASFKQGATQAFEVVSQELSKGNFEALEGLITAPTLEEIKKNITTRFSLKERMELAIVKEDILLSFPYQIGMIFINEGSQNERIFVEITMCYHVFRGFQNHVKKQMRGEAPSGVRAVYENPDRLTIANYRFIREFTKGVVDDWTISLANHFNPGQVLN